MEGAETTLPQQCVSHGELPPIVGPVTLENEIPLGTLATRHKEEHDGCEWQLLSTILQSKMWMFHDLADIASLAPEMPRILP